MFKKFMPDEYLDDIYKIDLDALKGAGVRAFICDIDNTLAPYEVSKPDERLMGWFSDVAERGIKVAFVSNNDPERVELFNKALSYPAFAKAGKPFKKSLLSAMDNMGSTAGNTVMIGDQVFTDVYAGKRIGLRCILVKPINDKKTLFFRFKRALEKPILKQYAKIHKN